MRRFVRLSIDEVPHLLASLICHRKLVAACPPPRLAPNLR